MVGKINKYYPLFKDDILATYNWLQSQELDKVSIYDVVIFRIGDCTVPFKHKEEIDTDLKLAVTDRDYKVEFLKITKRVDTGMLVYSYKSSIPVRQKMLDAKILLNQYGKCKFMPKEAIIPAEDPGNFTHEELDVGRETSGKYVCDNIDNTDTDIIKSTVWMPSVMYEDGKTELPIAHNGREIPEYVVNVISFLGKLGSNVHKYAQDDEVRNYNGIVVIPVLMLLKKVMDITQLIDKGNY